MAMMPKRFSATRGHPLASLPAGYNTTFSDHTWGYATTTLGYYASSPVDVHPHLVPDIHPWWFQWVPTFSFAEWRPCVAHNPVLYWNPTRNVINPPGAYLGGGGGAHAWIDYLSPLTPNVVKLANAAFAVGATGDWGTGLDISPWCIQMQSSGVYRRTWEPTLSSCVRFSLELERPLWHAPGDRNLQSFLVYRPGSILH